MKYADTYKTLSDEVLGMTADGWEAHLVTTVSYHKGGANYFTGRVDRRGYALIVRVEDHQNGAKRFTLFQDGLSFFVEEVKMFSAKRLASIVPPADKLAAMQEQVRAGWTARQARAQVSG